MLFIQDRSKQDRAPTVLLDFQKKWVADETPVKVWEKSRRIGASWGEAADTALLASSQEGMDSWYIGYNKAMAEEFIADCANWAKFYNLAASEISEEIELFEDGNEQKAILTYVIRFASGHKITALSSRPNNLRGKQGRVILDEFAFHDNPGELLKAAFALLIWGGQVHIISTHDGDSNPFNQLVQDVLAGKFPYSLHRTTFDDAVSQGLFKRVCLRTKKEWSPKAEKEWKQSIRDFYGDDAKEELDVIPAQGSGSWLIRSLIALRMADREKDTPVLRFEQPNDFNMLPDRDRAAITQDFIDEFLMPEIKKINQRRVTFVGEDFARSGDLSAYVPLVQSDNLIMRVPFILELKNIPHKNQEQIMIALLSNLPNLSGGAFDGRGNGHYIAERAQQLFGSIIEIVMFTEEWYRLNMPPMKAAFEDGSITDLPNDERVLSDLRAVKLINGVARVPATKNVVNGEARHGDIAIALALALFASRMNTIKPLSSPRTRELRSSQVIRGY